MDKAGVIFALLTVAAVTAGSWFFAGVYVSMTTERVAYEVLDDIGDGVEIRQYGEMTVISTVAKDSGDAFSSLASYIYGGNDKDAKIDMTAPVLSSEEGDFVNMSFVLPDAYGLDNAPIPDDSGVSVHAIPARKLAVIGFSGYANDDVIEKYRSILDQRLAASDVSTKGDYFLMRYDPPWVPPALMHNEVAIEVE
ncbi:heme-binding protein [Methanolobus sp. WCC4]|uniref:SOUL family heme-binding protein n=1 Tax=Methanolobus sp. WCC4 TaxID=3125784 RepID=UPI0030FC06E6